MTFIPAPSADSDAGVGVPGDEEGDEVYEMTSRDLLLCLASNRSRRPTVCVTGLLRVTVCVTGVLLVGYRRRLEEMEQLRTRRWGPAIAETNGVNGFDDEAANVPRRMGVL